MKYLLSLLLLSFCTFAKAEALLVYEVEFYPLAAGKNIPADSISKQNVSLYLKDSVFYVVRGQHISVYDFAKEKIYYFDMPAKTYDETSLYSEIDFRSAEFLNRLYMKQFLETGSLQNSIGTLFEMESLFGIEKTVDSLDGLISQVPIANGSDFFVDDQDICSVRYSAHHMGDYFNIFYRFLLYETQIHPQIVSSVCNGQKFPESLSFKFKNSGKEYFVRYTLKKHEPAASVTELNFNYYFFEYNFSNSLLTKINKIYGHIHHQAVTFTSREQVLKEYAAAVKKKKFLDAFLILMESKLSTDDDYAQQFQYLKENGSRDKYFNVFMSVLESQEEEMDLQTKIALIEKIKKKKLTRAWLLDAFLATYYASLEENQKAIELLENVVSKNPYITAVFVDLGQLLASSYKMKTAWKCYDIALKLNQSHPMAQRILFKKHYLKYTFPEYFF